MSLEYLSKLSVQIVRSCTVCGGAGCLPGQEPCQCSIRMANIAALAKGQVPPEYWLRNLTDENCIIEPHMRDRALEWVRFYTMTGDPSSLSFLFMGPIRVGKTTMAVGLLLEYLKIFPYNEVMYSTALDIEDAIFKDDRELLFRLEDTGMLVLDDVGKERTFSHVEPIKRVTSKEIDRIVRRRRNVKPTILIANASIEALKKGYGSNLGIILDNDFKKFTWCNESPKIAMNTGT